MKRKGKYGYIEFMDKRKFKDDGYDDAIEPEIRKPTPYEREEIILNFIRDNSGKSIKVTYLADKLAVSDRTIQKTIRKFEEQKLIKILPCFTPSNHQQGNIIKYIGADTPRSGLTLDVLYNPDNPCGFRDWNWKDFKVIPGYFQGRLTKRSAQYQYELLLKYKKKQKEKRDKLNNGKT